MLLESTFDLVPDLPAEELRARIVGAHRLCDAGHRALAFYLHDMQRRGVHQLLGCVSAVQFGVKVLGLDRRTARDLLWAGKAMLELAQVDRALTAGRLSWTKARLLTRIAVPQTEAAWIERAERLTCAELEAEVAISEYGRPPREDRLALPRVKLDVRLRLGPLAHEAWERVREMVSGGEHLSDDDLVMALAERLRSGEGGGPVQVLVQKCEDCRAASVVTEDEPVAIDGPAAHAAGLRRFRRTTSRSGGRAGPRRRRTSRRSARGATRSFMRNCSSLKGTARASCGSSTGRGGRSPRGMALKRLARPESRSRGSCRRSTPADRCAHAAGCP